MSFNFLRGYVDLLSHTEVTERLAVWSAIGTVSATLGRRVWLDMGIFTIYPNLYVLLIAASGRCKKSTAINYGEKLIRQLDPAPTIVGQKVTPEALIHRLRTIHTEDKKTMLKETCTGAAICDEVVTFLNRKNFEAGISTLLTSLWDCKEEFEYDTMARGTEKVRNACFTILGGATVHLIRDAIPEQAIGDGLTSRILFIFDDKPGHPVPMPVFSQAARELEEQLIRELQAISTFEGPVRLSDEAAEQYDADYRHFYVHSDLYDNKHFAGYASRRFVHLLKLAVIMSLTDSPDMVITLQHYQAAKHVLEEAEEHMPKVLNMITMSDAGDLATEVYALLARNGSMKRQELLQPFTHKLSAKEFADIMETLITSGKARMQVRGTTVVYEVVGK